MRRKKKKKNERTSVMYLRKIPSDLKTQFKAWCALRGKSLQDAIIDHMKTCVKDDTECASP